MTHYAREPIEVHLDVVDVNKVLKFVHELRATKEEHGVTDLHYDKASTSWGVDVLGYLGEVVASKVLDVPIDEEIRVHGDDGTDLWFNGARFQVKTSATGSLIFNSAYHFKCENALFIQFVGKDKARSHEDPRFRVWGWITRDDFLKNCYENNYGYGNRLVLDYPSLYSIQSLVKDLTTSI